MSEPTKADWEKNMPDGERAALAMCIAEELCRNYSVKGMRLLNEFLYEESLSHVTESCRRSVEYGDAYSKLKRRNAWLETAMAKAKGDGKRKLARSKPRTRKGVAA